MGNQLLNTENEMVEQTAPSNTKPKYSEDMQKIKKECKEYAEKMLAAAEALLDGWRLKLDETDYKIWIKKTDDGPCSAIRVRAQGITMKQVKQFITNICEYFPKVDTRVTLEELVPYGGARVLHLRYNIFFS